MTQLEQANPADPLLEAAITYTQRCLQTNPVIVLGSGASIPHGIPGMPALQQCLLTNVPNMDMTEDEAAKWAEFTTALQSKDLESALLEIRLPPALTTRIVEHTRRCIGDADALAFAAVLQERYTLPLTKLYQHLFRSSNALLHVVTTNYDRLAEYAANAVGIRSYVGFTDGHLQCWDEQLAELSRYDRSTSRRHPVRTVCVWKVHGSLDWFSDPGQQQPISLPMGCPVPDNFSPLMVTPGIEKYEATHQEPFRSVVSQADLAIKSSGAFFCVGYGFNDKHIQPKLIERCYRDRCPIVVLAKQLTQAAKEFMANQYCCDFLAIEECPQGSRVYSQQYRDGLELQIPSLWALSGLLPQTLAR